MKREKIKIFKIYSIIILFLIIIFFIWNENLIKYLKYSDLNDKFQKIDSQISEEKTKQIKLQNKSEFLKNPDTQIRILIEKNNLKKPGEKVIQILE